MSESRAIPLPDLRRLSDETSLQAASEFHALMHLRRTVRDFDSRPVRREVIEQCIAAAGTAPSGANQQPWHFVAVSGADVKRRIREAAEAEEREFYERRAPEEWLEALRPIGTDWRKPFLETAPFLVVVFALDWEEEALPDGSKHRHKGYYVQESVGIAVGMLLAALHAAGLATLTHTPSPMAFLARVLDRPRNERPFVLIPVGYPARDALVPDIRKKALDEIRTIV